MAPMDLEDSSVEMQEKSLTEAAEDTKTLPKDFVEVHKKKENMYLQNN